MVDIKRIIPLRIRKLLSDFLGITALHKRIDLLYELIELDLSHSAKESLWERSRTRWRRSAPNVDLTWGVKVSGDSFISKISLYSIFSPKTTILEIGAGYGRLLGSCLRKNVPFKKYIAIDISKENVAYLQKRFPIENIEIVEGDVEEISFNMKFDVIMSSLTLKHFYPSFQKALINLSNYLNPNGLIFFDLIEGQRRGFEADGVTYFRWYSKSEIRKILSDVSLEFVAFDRVWHSRDFSRLLVVAKRHND